MIEVRVHRSIQEIPAEEWDALDGASEVPFLGWTWLDALERTGCVGEEAGWLPHHLSFWDGEDGARRMIGAAPCYVKDNSEGEFVFDWAWASAAPRFRVRYYPKLLVAVPFTPATSHRVLVADPAERPRLLAALAETLRRVCEALEISSAHVLFPTAPEAEVLGAAGMAHRHGVQFQWHNAGYTSFDDFLAGFTSKRRAQLRRERREVRGQGVTVETLRGKDLTPDVVDAAYRFYLSTVDKFSWGRRYLNRAFFEEIAAKVPGVEVVLARNGSQKPIAGAVNLAGKTALFGRYWGALAGEELPFLHFEVCYYHSIEDAIARKLTRFEPGAGGSHKVARGFVPTVTHSVHHIENARFDRAIRNFLDEERVAVDAAVAAGEAPFRH
jgi:predicted N-acyltransferase